MPIDPGDPALDHAQGVGHLAIDLADLTETRNRREDPPARGSPVAALLACSPTSRGVGELDLRALIDGLGLVADRQRRNLDVSELRAGGEEADRIAVEAHASNVAAIVVRAVADNACTLTGRR